MPLESDFWKQLRKALIDTCPGVHATRIENTAVAGVSDVTICFRGREVWTELKVMRRGRLKFRTSQKVWTPLRRAAGGRVFCLARDENAVVYLFHGEICAAEGDVRGLEILSIKPPYQWKLLFGTLFSTSTN